MLSLLLCVATAVLWVRSYRISDEFRWAHVHAAGPAESESSHTYALVSGYGSFQWVSISIAGRMPRLSAGWGHVSMRALNVLRMPTDRGLTRWDRLGFVHQDLWVMQTYTAPAWAVLSVFALLPLLRMCQ